MKTYAIEIQGVAPMLHNKLSRELMKEKSKVQKDKKEEWEDSNWQKKLYTAEIDGKEVIIMPEKNIQALLVSACMKFRVSPPKSIGRTWTNYIKSCIIVPQPAIIECKKVSPLGCMVNGNPSSSKKSSKVYSVRPMIEDWKTKIIIQDADDSLGLDNVKELMSIAGKFVGMSDWRPQYGRFTVNKVVEVKL